MKDIDWCDWQSIVRLGGKEIMFYRMEVLLKTGK